MSPELHPTKIVAMTEDNLAPDEVQAPMYFLDRVDQWNVIKPYNFQYYPKEDFPRHNLQHSPCTTKVKNMRSCVPSASLNIEGFEIRRLVSKMTYSDFYDDATIENIYCRELEKHFKEDFGAKHVRALDYQVNPSFEKN
ncbi:MAG: hypothetical protein Q9198_000262 [Flavoplaca austrocitrina]